MFNNYTVSMSCTWMEGWVPVKNQTYNAIHTPGKSASHWAAERPLIR